MQIEEMTCEHISLWENINSGQNTDGKFGTNLFENKGIEIDFTKNIIIVRRDLPAKTKKYEKLSLFFEHDNMFVEAGWWIGNNSYKNVF